MKMLFSIDVDIHRYALKILLIAPWMSLHGLCLLHVIAADRLFDFLIDMLIKVMILITSYPEHCRIFQVLNNNKSKRRFEALNARPYNSIYSQF